MTLFADTLKKYLETKNTTIYTISKISGVDRTMIQHMKVGKRMPANVADVTAIAKAMSSTPVKQQNYCAPIIYHIWEKKTFSVVSMSAKSSPVFTI